MGHHPVYFVSWPVAAAYAGSTTADAVTMSSLSPPPYLESGLHPETTFAFVPAPLHLPAFAPVHTHPALSPMEVVLVIGIVVAAIRVARAGRTTDR